MSAPCLVRVKTSVPRPGRLAQPMGEQLQLLPLVDEEHRLPDRLDRDRGGRDAHVDGIGQPLAGQRPNGRGQRGGKQQRLPPAGDLGDDPPQIVDKAHVEHPVGLVEDQHLDVREVHEALLHQVQQPPRGGDQNVHALVQCGHLRPLADAAVDYGLPHGGMAAVGLETLADLQGQFARGGEHQGAYLAAAPATRHSTRLSRCKVGRAKAAVLPVPVSRIPARHARRGSAGWRRLEFPWWRGSPAHERRKSGSARPRSSNFINNSFNKWREKGDCPHLCEAPPRAVPANGVCPFFPTSGFPTRARAAAANRAYRVWHPTPKWMRSSQSRLRRRGTAWGRGCKRDQWQP